jgi:UDP-N-acetylglucosamine--N-acetylmuramyl-(pentapeptide) pyrophosphoryl-undecaprenol N-acetylglucosamine transferase
MSKLKVIISGGGTGGHIYPAIAIANAIKVKQPDAEILFIGAEGKMEMEKVPQAGYNIIGLPIVGIQRRLTLKNLKVPFLLLKSLAKAKKIIKEFQPQVVIGVGGYASGPTLKTAEKLNIPTLLQEQNSYPGITNKLLAQKANVICVAYDNMERFFPKEKILMTGNPVRQDIVNLTNKKQEALAYFNLKNNKPTVLVIGGSLGAKTINMAIEKMLPFFKENNIQLIWQTGKNYADKAKQAVQNINSDLIITMPFIARMDYAYAAADIVISRAGALSVSEIAVAKKPAIFIPSPNVAEDHQTKNAMALVSHNAALMVKDAEAEIKLKPEIEKLLNDASLQQKLINNISPLGKPNAADDIANEVLKLAGVK